jgi:hypothetical protein
VVAPGFARVLTEAALEFAKLGTCMLLTGSLALAGCPGDDTSIDDTGTSTGAPGTSTGEPPGTSTGEPPGTSTGEPGSESGVVDSSSGGDEPWPEFDCAGATEVLDGNVLIETEDDLAQLEGVREVTRSIVVNQTALTNLDFLGCIDTVGENLQIFGNEQLTNVDGLVNVQVIRGTLIFGENHAMVDFDGLQRLTEVEGSFSMNKNDGLQHISGFDSLIGVEGDVTIRDNEMLLDIDGLKGLMVINGVLAITANPMLCISSVNCVGAGIVIPAVPPPEWSTIANDESC